MHQSTRLAGFQPVSLSSGGDVLKQAVKNNFTCCKNYLHNMEVITYVWVYIWGGQETIGHQFHKRRSLGQSLRNLGGIRLTGFPCTDGAHFERQPIRHQVFLETDMLFL